MGKRTVNRRQALKLMGLGTCGGAAHVLAGSTAGSFVLTNPLAASSASATGLPLIIVVNLDGGVSLNIAPSYTSQYRAAFPTLSFEPSQSHPLTATQGLHPSLGAIKNLWNRNQLAVVNLVGYRNIAPNRSHAESARYWQLGRTSELASHPGWGTRLTELIAGSLSGDRPLIAVSLSGAAEIVSGGTTYQPLALDSLFGLDEAAVWPYTDYDSVAENDRMRELREAVLSLEPLSTGRVNYDYVRGAQERFRLRLREIQDASTVQRFTTTFPQSYFGQKCLETAKLISASSLGVQFVYLSFGGFDTHDNEASRLTALLSEINGGLQSLIAALEEMGRWNDTVIITQSEFFRTFENGNRGTDHGHAGPHLVMGGRVRGGIKTPGPSPSSYENTSFFAEVQADFRDVYAEVLNRMGMPGDQVFSDRPGLAPLGLI